MKEFAFCLVSVIMGVIVGASVQKDTDKKEGFNQVSTEYVKIGNNINRTDDREMGVSCYVRYHEQMSCVMTGVGLEGGPK